MEREPTYKQNKSDNLNKRERKPLNELNNNPNIIINKVDKGNSVVVEDRSTYLYKKCYETLKCRGTEYKQLSLRKRELRWARLFAGLVHV